jgi:hypothetical protein
MPDRERHRLEEDVDAPAEQLGERAGAAAEGHVHDVGPGHRVEELAGKMVHGADARGGEVQLARVRPGLRDEGAERRERRVGAHADHERVRRQHRDHRDVGERIEGQRLHGRRLHRVGAGDEKQRIAVGRLLRRVVVADEAAGARPVVDHHRLAERFAEGLRGEARDHVR